MSTDRPITLHFLTLILVGLLGLTGCGRSPQADSSLPAIQDIFVNPSRIAVAKPTVVTLGLRNVGDHQKSGIYYSWGTSNGEFVPKLTREPKSTLTPANDSPARITVTMEINGRAASSMDRYVEVIPENSAPQRTAPVPVRHEGEYNFAFSTVPPYKPDGGATERKPIAGRISGISPADVQNLRVVIYSKALENFYVQPTEAEPFTDIGKDGEFESNIHLGGEYAVLLVDTSFNPPLVTPVLPRVGANVYASIRVPGTKVASPNVGEPQ